MTACARCCTMERLRALAFDELPAGAITVQISQRTLFRYRIPYCSGLPNLLPSAATPIILAVLRTVLFR